MEPTTQSQPPLQKFTDTSRLFCVTKASKYLAMALFIILPFLGAYLGFVNAPEKVVEVERIVYKDARSAVEKQERENIDVDDESRNTAINEDIIAIMTESPENVDSFINAIGSTYVSEKEFIMTGTYSSYEKCAWEITEQCHGLKLGSRPQNFWHFKTLLNTLTGNSVNQIENKSLVINLPWEQVPESDKKKIVGGDKVNLLLTAKVPLYTGVGPCYSFFNYVGLAS